ncbi:MAG: 50S ribosomal protein L28 [Pelagibacterales bacterium]|nr:50S ribosomal protein L28 [Pelagibacterales bacterium]|tara:strand:- start:169 stop:459 length:291 start_codon:yes stop_codon:yes gene_type:complete
MSRVCELTGKKVMTGNNVSHAKNRTRRRFLPNLQNISLFSEVLEKTIKFRVSSSAIRTVEKKGGIDKFLISAYEKDLSTSACHYKKLIEKKEAAKS